MKRRKIAFGGGEGVGVVGENFCFFCFNFFVVKKKELIARI